MSEVGSLVTKFEIDNTQFLREIAESNRKLVEFAQKTNATGTATSGAAQGLGRMGAAIKSLVAISGVYLLARQFDQLVNRIGDLVDQTEALGVSTQSFSELAAVARGAGVSSDSLASAMSKLRVSIGQASLGVKTQSDTLKSLGLDYKELQKLSLDQQFLAVSKALRQVDDATQRAALAQQLLGKGSKQALAFISSDIDSAVKQYRELGIEITDVQAKQVDAFDDNRKLLGAAFTGFGEQLVAELAPALNDVSEAVLQWIKDMGGIKSLAQSFKDTMLSAVDGLRSFFDSTITRFVKIQEFAKELELKRFDVNNVETNNKGLTPQQIMQIVERPELGIGGDKSLAFSQQGIDATGSFIPSLSLAKERAKITGELDQLQNLRSAQEAGSPANTELVSSIPSIANALSEASKQVDKFGKSVSSATDDLISAGLASNSGISEQIGRIIGGTQARPVAKDASFDAAASEIIDIVKNNPDGAKNGFANDTIKSRLGFLDATAIANSQRGLDTTAQKGAIEELNKYLQKAGILDTPQVKVKISVDKEGIIKAVLDNEQTKGAVIEYFRAATAEEARGVNR